ncbi:MULTISPECIES: urea ABC transporter permease subunit UrtB [Cyanophyceae]|uniref:ABC transporter permease n=1 Tax=Cyanophyceae TaxID=3028117 RepID=UPI00016DC685|nr:MULTISPECIES: urea ABC transporter permease subunit UrtB [Cyanophyceae]ACA98407.1 ABC transporter, branched-chain amino acid transport system, permease component [Picosynechococcus sp. PCC 7002]SMH46571.1 urea ABC transporter membrane protein [Picosynechococcus sp. OG1]SMQ80706.1 urea ABC transporter membrane protein [Synechococcus sp. 7002]
MTELLIGIFNGVSIGSVLLVSALGLAIAFGLMGVINLAHGELMMLGAYTTFVVQNVFRGFGEPFFNLYIIFAIPLAFFVAAAVGFGLERGVIRYLYGRPLETLLATWGVSLILQQFVRSVNWAIAFGVIAFLLKDVIRWAVLQALNLAKIQSVALKMWLDKLNVVAAFALGFGVIFGVNLTKNDALTKPWFSARNVDVTAPQWLQGGLSLGSAQLPYSRIFIIVLTLICLGAMYWFLNKSNWGLRIRAVTQNREMSSCLGIPTARVDALTFALGSGLAGIAGVAIALLGSVGPNTGQNYIVDAFMVVVVGGVGNLLGTILAALGLGIINYLIGSGTFVTVFTSLQAPQFLLDLATFFATTSMAKVMTFVIIIGFLQFRPAGLFPPKGRTAEL